MSGEFILTGCALLAIALAIFRLLRGPAPADRIIALDVVFAASIALCVAAALRTGRTAFLDVAIGLALVGFVAAIVWARLVDASPAQDPGRREDQP